MYHLHWGLRESPFRNVADPRYFYRSPGHDEALARLHFLTDQRRRLGLLAAPTGCGKTLLLEVLAGELRRAGQAVARTNVAGLSSEEWVWDVAAGLGLSPPQEAGSLRLWRLVCDALAANRYQRLATVVLLDDADQAGDDVQVAVERLLAADPTPEGRLTVVLACERGSESQLRRRLLDQADLRVELEPWEAADTAEYVHEALRRGGRRDAGAFSSEALSRLHELAGGIPRRVNQLADLALLAGAGQDMARIGPDIVEAVHDELSVRADRHPLHGVPVAAATGET
jgi:type II secretory pathway predicted ATPase ExeA